MQRLLLLGQERGAERALLRPFTALAAAFDPVDLVGRPFLASPPSWPSPSPGCAGRWPRPSRRGRGLLGCAFLAGAAFLAADDFGGGLLGRRRRCLARRRRPLGGAALGSRGLAGARRGRHCGHLPFIPPTKKVAHCTGADPAVSTTFGRRGRLAATGEGQVSGPGGRSGPSSPSRPDRTGREGPTGPIDRRGRGARRRPSPCAARRGTDRTRRRRRPTPSSTALTGFVGGPGSRRALVPGASWSTSSKPPADPPDGRGASARGASMRTLPVVGRDAPGDGGRRRGRGSVRGSAAGSAGRATGGGGGGGGGSLAFGGIGSSFSGISISASSGAGSSVEGLRLLDQLLQALDVGLELAALRCRGAPRAGRRRCAASRGWTRASGSR